MRLERLDVGAGSALAEGQQQAQIQLWVDLRNDATLELLGTSGPPVSTDYVRLTATRTDQRYEFFLAYDEDGTAVGSAWLAIPGHTGRDDAEVMFSVAPTRRRKGLGRAILSELERFAAANGCTRVVLDQGSPHENGAPGAEFAATAGYHEVGMVLTCRLDLPIPPQRCAELERDARGADAAYEIVTAWDELPDAWLAERAELAQHLSSHSPETSIEHVGQEWDAERIRTVWMHWLSGGAHAVESVAMARDGGGMVAFSDLVIYGADPRHATQSDTLVLPEHRGHRLGLAVKLANLRALTEHFPQVEAITTWTSAHNAPMRALNESMGFQVIEWVRLWARDL